MMDDDAKKAQHLTGTDEGGTDMPPSGGAGEDEGSSSADGKDNHLKDEQKPTDH